MWELTTVLLIGFYLTIFYMSHPLKIALALIAVASLIGGNLGLMSSSWLTLALVLVFLGGMMVIFLYFTSLISTEKLVSTKSPRFLVWGLVFVSAAAIGGLTPVQPFLLCGGHNFMAPNMAINAILILYLLFILFLVVKLTESFKGTLELTCY